MKELDYTRKYRKYKRRYNRLSQYGGVFDPNYTPLPDYETYLTESGCCAKVGKYYLIGSRSGKLARFNEVRISANKSKLDVGTTIYPFIKVIHIDSQHKVKVAYIKYRYRRGSEPRVDIKELDFGNSLVNPTICLVSDHSPEDEELSDETEPTSMYIKLINRSRAWYKNMTGTAEVTDEDAAIKLARMFRRQPKEEANKQEQENRKKDKKAAAALYALLEEDKKAAVELYTLLKEDKTATIS
jgi:hypothetical protein